MTSTIHTFFKRSVSIIAAVFFFGVVGAYAQQVFIANLSSAQEVPVNNSTGKGVCKIVLNQAQTQITVNCRYSGLSSSAQAGHIHGSAPIGTNAPVLFNFGTVTGTSGTISPAAFTVTPAQVAAMRSMNYYVNIHTVNNPGGEIRGQIHLANNTFSDYDGDGRTDITVRRPSEGRVYSRLSLNGALKVQQWGLSTDFTGRDGDFDGDGISDYTVVRVNPNTGQGTWLMLMSETNSFRATDFGNVALGDTLAAGDFDGDGAFDIGVFRNGLWIYLESSTNQIKYFPWGKAGDVVQSGDYDGDGKTDFAVSRVENNLLKFYIRLSSTGQLKEYTSNSPTDQILARGGDFDGDGLADIGFSRATTNNNRELFYVSSINNATVRTTFGLTTDSIVEGEFDGDGKRDVAAVRTISGQLFWYVLPSSTNQFYGVQWGLSTDTF